MATVLHSRLSFFFAGIFNLVIMRFHGDHIQFIRVVTWVNLLMLGILIIIGGFHFIYPPIVAFSFCLIAFALSLLAQRSLKLSV